MGARLTTRSAAGADLGVRLAQAPEQALAQATPGSFRALRQRRQLVVVPNLHTQKSPSVY